MTSPASPSDQLVRATDDGPVRTLTLTRPTRLNAFPAASYRRLAQLLHDAADDPDVRIVALRGQGRAFCSGVDLEEVGAEGGQGGAKLGEIFDSLVEALLEFEKPLVCGRTRTGRRLRRDDPVALRRGRDGGRQAAALPVHVPQHGPGGRQQCAPAGHHGPPTRELFFTSHGIDAAEAVRYGLVLSTCPRQQLDAEVRTLAKRIAL